MFHEKLKLYLISSICPALNSLFYSLPRNNSTLYLSIYGFPLKGQCQKLMAPHLIMVGFSDQASTFIIIYFIVYLQGRSRDPRRRATVGYSQHNRSMDYEGTLSEIDGPTFHRGGFIRSSLPAARSPPTRDKPPGNHDFCNFCFNKYIIKTFFRGCTQISDSFL